MGKIILVTEAARRLGVHRQTIMNWMANGLIEVKKVGSSYFMDEDTVTAISDTVEDIERTKKKMADFSERLHMEYRERVDGYNDDRIRRKFLNLCVLGGIRSGFFESIVKMEFICGILSEREAYVLLSCLRGDTMKEISERYNLTKERIRQIAFKAVRRSGHLNKFSNMVDELDKLRKDNESLKIALAEGYRESLIPSVSYAAYECIYETLTKRISDCGFSTRAHNALVGSRLNIETIGDVVKLSRADLLRFRNMGRKSMLEIEDFMNRHDLKWGMNVDKYYKLHAARVMGNAESYGEEAVV